VGYVFPFDFNIFLLPLRNQSNTPLGGLIMLNAGQLIVREYPMEVIQADAMEDLLRLFESLILFEATVANVNTPKDRLTMVQTMDEILLMVDYCVLGYMGEEPVAMMLVDKGEPYAIGSLFVNEHYRSQGIGELLVGYLQSYHPTQQLTVSCYKGNTRALSFYRRLGFEFAETELIMKGVRNSF
jgi:ribosomal protein S18 acetylase RimI-like enzyme